MLSLWAVFGLGLLGGCANVAAVAGGHFQLPSRTAQGFHLGFLNAAFLGGVAALVTYWLGDLGKLDFGHQAGLSVASGVSGGSIIAGLMQRRRTAAERAKAETYKESADDLTDIVNEVVGEP